MAWPAARHLPWSQVGTVRAQAVRRWGRDSVMLEMDVVDADGTERMLVFGRLDLGDDPEDVAEAVSAAAPARHPPSASPRQTADETAAWVRQGVRSSA